MLKKQDIKNITANWGNEKRIPLNRFDDFTYACNWHWDIFKPLDEELFGESVNPFQVGLKQYQDLFVYTFIKDHVPPGTKILDVGGGKSRILTKLQNEYECWNVDKMEGLGNGPRELNNVGYRLVKDYMGNFNRELPDDYFDFVFSISALEHVPQDDSVFLQNIIDDMDRVLKQGCYSLHLFDIVYQGTLLKRFNKFIYHIFTSVRTVNEFVHPNFVGDGFDLYFLPREAYERKWKRITKKTYESFGKPSSINALWQKS